MIDYKDYQNKVLASIEAFIGYLKKYKEPDFAFNKYLKERTIEETGISENVAYKDFPKNAKTPFACIRVPTGGGKTLLAVETIAKTQINFLERKGGLVMLFVPSEAIYSQTLAKLKDFNDFHRQILAQNFNQIYVFSKDEALKQLRLHHFQNGSLTIIVSIIDSFTMGKKVFDDGIDGFEQFNDIIEKNQNLILEEISSEKKSQKIGKISLFNIIRAFNPQIIIDEGHLHKSDLIQSTIFDLNPSIIWEFSATPQVNSNIIHRTSPFDLKKEQMIKLPIQIRQEPTWQDVLEKAIILQKELEEKAKKEEENGGKYLRPIVLIRPNQIKESDDEAKITPAKIKEYIKKNHPQILTKEDDEIAYQLAERYCESNSQSAKRIDTLGEVKNLFSKNSNIRFIIAYNAIREGWDCSFAYIYANLSNIKSETDAEQFLGRILRMPYAKQFQNEDLNKAYVISVGKNNDATELEAGVNSIISILTKSGFDKNEAQKSVATGNKNEETLPIIAKKQQNIDKILLPQIYFEDEKLDRFCHLMSGFNLGNIELKDDLELIVKTAGIVEIDIDEKDEWSKKGLDNELSIGFLDFSSQDLIGFIAKQARDKNFPKELQIKIIKNWVEELLKKQDLKSLARNLFALIEYYKKQKKELIENCQRSNFEKAANDKKIKIKNDFELIFDEKQEIYGNYSSFANSIYDKCDNLNNLEKNEINKINFGENDWFYRNRSKKDFYLQGWWGKFYPDFIVFKGGKITILETKGREDEKDKEKKKLGDFIKSNDKNINFEWIL